MYEMQNPPSEKPKYKSDKTASNISIWRTWMFSSNFNSLSANHSTFYLHGDGQIAKEFSSQVSPFNALHLFMLCLDVGIAEVGRRRCPASTCQTAVQSAKCSSSASQLPVNFESSPYSRLCDCSIQRSIWTHAHWIRISTLNSPS